MLHDYHLYTAPGLIREQRPDAFLHFFVHIPWSQPDSWRILPGRIREAVYRGMLANDIIGFHTSAYCRNFLRCCDELIEVDVDFRGCKVTHPGGQTLVRAYPLSIDAERLERAAASEEVLEAEREVLERRRKYLIIRVDRADLSKNVLRGFTAFDTFLQQHPEFREKVTFIAHLQPSRQDVPEYAEYLERIEALVAVVNHRHGTTDWMPIDLKIYENFPEAVARYKQFDLLMVNSIFDGMNLVAKEAPTVNTRNGVLMLSENTGSHEELADCALSVNPFDIQEQAETIYRALTMDPEEKRLRAARLKQIIDSRNPGDWVDEQLDDIRAVQERAGGRASPGLRRSAPIGRLRAAAALATSLAALIALLAAGTGSGSPGAARAPGPHPPKLRRCDLGPPRLFRCGHVKVPVRRGHPGLGKLKVAFALRPRVERGRRSLGTIVGVEGGPGYAATDRPYAASLIAALGPILRRRDLLLIDERGTGRSGAVHCDPLQRGQIQEHIAVGECADQLGARYARVHHGGGRRRHRRGPPLARPRPHLPLRRLLRHPPGPGIRRPPRLEAAGADPRLGLSGRTIRTGAPCSPPSAMGCGSPAATRRAAQAGRSAASGGWSAASMTPAGPPATCWGSPSRQAPWRPAPTSTSTRPTATSCAGSRAG